MDIAEWRKKIDELDQRLVEVLNERAKAAQQIGHLKQNTDIPVYEPDREKQIYQNVCRENKGPLPNTELVRVYERIIDVMRKIQMEDIDAPMPKAKTTGQTTELEPND